MKHSMDHIRDELQAVPRVSFGDLRRHLTPAARLAAWTFFWMVLGRVVGQAAQLGVAVSMVCGVVVRNSASRGPVWSRNGMIVNQFFHSG